MPTYPISQIDKLIPGFAAERPSQIILNQQMRIARKSRTTAMKDCRDMADQGLQDVSDLYQAAADLYADAGSLAVMGSDAYCKLWEAKEALGLAHNLFLAYKAKGLAV